MTSIQVIKPGMLTTVQDLGRWGYQTHGVPVSGPMDAYSHRLANRLVGNHETAATLEVTLIGPEVVFQGEAVFAIAGAEFTILLNGEERPIHEVQRAPTGSVLRFGSRRRGSRAYLAIAGGIDVSTVLGSRATHVASRMGGLDGRALIAGDTLPIGPAQAESTPAGSAIRALAMPVGGACLRVMLGPQADWFRESAVETLQTARYLITPQSDRIGYRLEGPRLEHAGAAEIISDATAIGSLQVPASGQPILLMADRGTTGGYPKIATVISADLPIAGQLAPGDWMEFIHCERADALRALREQEQRLTEA